jgi:ubiquinone biosynthesis protein
MSLSLKLPKEKVPFVFYYVGRTIRILLLSIVFLVLFSLRRFAKPLFGPRLLRWYFQSCSAGFVKLGQILAMRYDLFPAMYCEELSKLLDRLPPLPTDIIINVIERELKRPISECFKYFEREPVSSASIAQVHKATLFDGSKVVVKVKRPLIEKRFKIDFLNVRFIARRINRFKLLANIDAIGVVNEFIELTKEELDFHREARNAQLLHDLMLEDNIDHYSPKVYFDLSTNEIVTLEELEGIWMRELLTAINNGDYDKLQVWAEQGITPKRIARLLLYSTLEQGYHHRVFHADPHAANLILLEGGTLGYVDFGMVGWLDEKIWAQQVKMTECMANEKIHEAYEALLASLEPLPIRDLTQFELECKGMIRDWIIATKSPHSTIVEKSSGYFLLRLFDAIRRAKLSLAFGVTRLFRALIISDITILKLNPEFNRLPDLKNFFQNEARRQLESYLSKQNLYMTLSTLLMAFMKSPAATMNLVNWTQDKLPEFGRIYKSQLTKLEQAFVMFLRYLKTAFLVLTIAALGGRFVAPRYWPDSAVVTISESLGSTWWLVISGALLSTFILGRLIHVIERSD